MNGREGHILFLEAKDTKVYPLSIEIVCTRETPNVIYGAPIRAGYEGSEERQYYKTQYNIISDTVDWAVVRQHVEDMTYFAGTIKRGEKPVWVESVYLRASEIARLIARTLPMIGPGEVVPYIPTPPPVSRTEYTTLAERVTRLEQAHGSLQVKLRSV
jgi:hypothetical protein